MEKNNDAGGTPERVIRCDECGCAFEPEMLMEKDGDIEVSFFRCDYCGKAFIVSVTDGTLREGIREYQRLLELNREERLGEPGQFKMQELKARNVEREMALRNAYLKEAADD